MTGLVDVQLDDLLRGWEPRTAGARELAGLYCSTLNEHVARRCIQVTGDSDGGTASRAEALLPSLADSRWTSPALAYAHHVTLADTARAEHAAGLAVNELERVARTDVPELELAPAGPVPEWVEGSLAMFARDQRHTGGHFVQVQAVTPDAKTLEACRHAVMLIDECWPEMARTTETFARELRWFAGPDDAITSVTLTQAFGAVFVPPAPSVALYEFIVHEVTHLELMARMAIDKLIVNRGQRARSPFRPDERPLTRVLHAALVAVRLVHAMDCCCNLLDPGDRRIAESRRTAHADDARAALQTLAEHAHWTPVGRELFDSMRSALASITPGAGRD